MDLKHKSEAWVGNIYQKLEAVRHEVDNFVSKDTVKYVENQVQTVGESLTRFCSDVVQDLLPSSFTESRTKSVKTFHQKFNDPIDTKTKSNIKTEERHVNITDLQASAKQQNPDFLESGHDENILVFEDTGMGIQGNVNADIEEFVCKEKSHPQIFHSPKIENEAPLLHVSNGEYCSTEFVDKVSSLAMVDFTPSASACCNNDLHSNISSESRSSNLAFSFVSTGSEVAEMKLISCSSSFSTEFIHLSGSTHTIPPELENNCYDHIDSVTCVSDTSSTTSYSKPVTNSGPENDADMHLAFCHSVSLLESTDVGSSRMRDCAADETYKNTHVLDCNSSMLEDLRSSARTDSSMEIIDISDKGKSKESSMIADDKLLFSVSCRPRRHKSYKKVIQDAFTLRKRLTKEYEQLGILYGDIDAESVEHPKQNPPLSTADTLITKKHSTDKDLCGSEWELL